MDAPGPRPFRHTDSRHDVNRLTGSIVDAVGLVRRELGAGLLEKVYSECLRSELEARGHRVEVEVPVAIRWRGTILPNAFRMDMRVDDTVVVELKAVEKLHALHFAQVITYLRLGGHPVGLLINFSAVPLRDGIHRLMPPKNA